MTRRSYSGNTQPTTLSGPITNVDTTLTVASGTNYPDGSGGPAVLTLDAGNASEEKVLYTSRTGNVFSGLTRGFDGTTAVGHSSGASVRHSLSATDINEANAHINATANAHAATAISNTPAGNIAATNVQAALNELDTEKLATTAGQTKIFLNVKDYGAVGDGVTDDSAAINTALAVAGRKDIVFPAGTYMCHGLAMSVNETHLHGPGILKKNANGDLITVTGTQCEIRLRIIGNGATYTGTGITIPSSGHDFLFDGIIDTTASYCIDIAANSGWRSRISGFLQAQGGAFAAVRISNGVNETNGDRMLTNINCGGGPLVDLGGSATTLITGCNTASSGIIFTSTSKKASITGCRLACPSTTVSGLDHVFTGNIVGGTLSLDATTSNCVVVGNRIVNGGAAISNAGTANVIASNNLS